MEVFYVWINGELYVVDGDYTALKWFLQWKRFMLYIYRVGFGLMLTGC